MDLEEDHPKSETWHKLLMFLGGFLGWFLINTLIYAILNLGHNGRYLGYSGLFWVIVLFVNIVVLTVLATLKKTRWIAFGIVGAMALNFMISTAFLSTQDAACFIPVTYPIYPSKSPVIRPRPTVDKARTAVPVNKNPIGFHDGNGGIVGGSHCVAFGWTTDPDDRNIDLTVRVLSDGEELVRQVAKAYRSDLNVANGCPGGFCGFEIKLGDLIADGEPHYINVQAQDAQTGGWTSLSNSPKKLTCLK
jgi:hypothetical protein